jgi:hypothetical protein
MFKTWRHARCSRLGDMPDAQDFRERLDDFDDFRVLPFLAKKDMDNVEDTLMIALPQVMHKANAEEEDYESVPAGAESNQRRGISVHVVQ